MKIAEYALKPVYLENVQGDARVESAGDLRRDHSLALPAGAQVLGAAPGPASVILVVREDPSRRHVERRFHLARAGDDFPDGAAYVGTVHWPTVVPIVHVLADPVEREIPCESRDEGAPHQDFSCDQFRRFVIPGGYTSEFMRGEHTQPDAIHARSEMGEVPSDFIRRETNAARVIRSHVSSCVGCREWIRELKYRLSGVTA